MIPYQRVFLCMCICLVVLTAITNLELLVMGYHSEWYFFQHVSFWMIQRKKKRVNTLTLKWAFRTISKHMLMYTTGVSNSWPFQLPLQPPSGKTHLIQVNNNNSMEQVSEKITVGLWSLDTPGAHSDTYKPLFARLKLSSHQTQFAWQGYPVLM